MPSALRKLLKGMYPPDCDKVWQVFSPKTRAPAINVMQAAIVLVSYQTNIVAARIEIFNVIGFFCNDKAALSKC